MRDYKGWTANERLASLKKTKAAIAAGIIPSPTKCNRCGKTTGRIDYHNHNYSDPIKYLEQMCQGCHIRLHRQENEQIAEQDGKQQQSVAVKQIISKESKREKFVNHKPAGISEKMHSIRVSFTQEIGLNWSENLNPSTGYKYEHNSNKRQQFLDRALELRDQYAKMVSEHNKGKDILEKMDRNLANRDRQAVWK